MARNKRRSKTESYEELLDSRLFKLGTRLAVGLVVAVVFLTLAQCTIKKPESPEWTTTLTVPVINRTYPMSELVWRLDEDGVAMDSDSNIVYSISEEVDTVRLDQDELATRDIDTSVNRTLGPIDINPPTVSDVAVPLSDLVPLITVVPDTNITIENDLDPLASFSSATVSSGDVYIVVINNLAVTLDNVIVNLYDIYVPAVPVLIGSRTFATPLDDGVTDSVLFSLAGKTFSNRLRIETQFHTPGGTGLRTGTKELVTATHFNGALSVSSATGADVPVISLDDTTLVLLGEASDTEVIQSATLGGGNLVLTVSNYSAVAATLTISFPDLMNGSQPLVSQEYLAPLSSQTDTVDVTGYELIPGDQTLPQLLEIIASVVTVADTVDINESQFFNVQSSLESLAFSSATGVFSTTEATITPTQQDIDVPNGFDGFSLSTVVLTLEIENSVQLPGQLDIQLAGDNGQILNLTGTVAAGTADSTVTTVIVEPDAAALLNPIPSRIDITGTAEFGDGVTPGTITTNDFILATIKLVSPLEMIISPSTIEADEVEAEDIDAEDIDIITDHVEQLLFICSIENSLPVGVSANLYLSKTADVSATTFDLDISALSVEAAPHTAGLSTGISSSVDTVLLTDEDIQILNTDSLYIYTELDLAGSGGEVVRLVHDNSITIVGRLQVDYLFDGEF